MFNTVDLLGVLHGDEVWNPVSRLEMRNISIALHPTLSVSICDHTLMKSFLFQNIKAQLQLLFRIRQFQIHFLE